MTRRHLRHGPVPFVGILILFAALWGCGEKTGHEAKAPPAENQVQGTLTYRLAFPPRTLNPLTAGVPLDLKLIRFHLHLKLLERDPATLEAVPCLAASWPTLSPDGRVHSWTIRDKACWPDGRPVTGADAGFAWSILSSDKEAVKAACGNARAALQTVVKVVATGEKTFDVHYLQRTANVALVFGLNFSPLPRHLVGGPEDAIKRRYLAGSGPYLLSSWKDDVIELEQVPNWWGHKDPLFANRWRVMKFRYKVVRDPVQVVEQLKAGDLDFSALGIKEYRALMKDKKRWHLEGAHYYLPQWSYIGFNCGSPIFTDQRVRRALSLLIPRDRINRRFYGGMARTVSGPFFRDSPFNDKNIPADTYNPLKAGELLEQAGWFDRDKDGFRDKDGQKMTFVLSRTQAGLSWSKGLVEEIRDAFAQAGIEMVIDTQSQGTLYGQTYPLAQHQAYAEVWEIDPIYPDVDMRTTFHSSETSRQGYNWQQYRNPTLDLLIEKMLRTEDREERIKLAHRMHALIKKETPMAFLFNNPACVIWNERIKGVTAYPLGVRQWDFRVQP